MKKFVTGLLSLAMVLTCFNGVAFATESTAPENEGNTVIIEGNLSDPSTYEDELNRLMADPTVDRVRVIDSSQISTSSTDSSPDLDDNITVLDDDITLFGGATYYTYRITNVTSGKDYTGKTAIAVAKGGPGDSLSIKKTKSVSCTYSCSVSAITAAKITAAVGYDVTKSESVEISGTATVPSTHNGKTVKKMTYTAYPIYKTKSFTVQRKKHIGAYHMLPWKDYSTGYARRPYGVDFEKTYTYA